MKTSHDFDSLDICRICAVPREIAVDFRIVCHGDDVEPQPIAEPIAEPLDAIGGGE